MSRPDRALGIFVLRVLVLLAQGSLVQRPLVFGVVPKTRVPSKQRGPFVRLIIGFGHGNGPFASSFWSS